MGVYRKKILHSLRNILDYHCRAFVKGEGGGALCSIVYVVRVLDGEGSCGLNAYTLVELTWMVFEAGSELKLVTDGVVTVTTFVVFVDTDAGVGEVTFAPSV